MHERPSPETIKRKYRRLRHLPAVVLAAFLASTAVSGTAKAVPSFTGAANVEIDLLGFGGIVVPGYYARQTYTDAGTPPDAANASATATTATGIPGGMSLGGTIGGMAPLSFAEAASISAADIGIRTSPADGAVLSLSISGPSIALGVTDGAFVAVDFLLALETATNALAPNDAGPTGSNGNDTPSSGVVFTSPLFDPANAFAPEDVLYSCSASTLDPTGCFGSTTGVVVGIEPNSDLTLTALLVIRGSTLFDPAGETADAVPAPSALGLFGLAVVGLGVASRRRRVAA